jgi:hypothetical protein
MLKTYIASAYYVCKYRLLVVILRQKRSHPTLSLIIPQLYFNDILMRGNQSLISPKKF